MIERIDRWRDTPGGFLLFIYQERIAQEDLEGGEQMKAVLGWSSVYVQPAYNPRSTGLRVRSILCISFSTS